MSKTIKPLRLKFQWYPIVATNLELTMFESVVTEDIFTKDHCPQLLQGIREMPHIWATVDPGTLFMQMHSLYKGDPNWSYRGLQSTKIIPDLSRKLDRDIGVMNTHVWRFGWRRTSRTNHASQMHFLLDLRGFLTREELRSQPVLPVELLFERAQEVRDFCHSMGLGPRHNFAGIASTLLRHPQFYPQERKRVPTWLNEKARPYLPGNHYDVMTKVGVIIKAASYHDQRSAHHHAALNVYMPTSDSLMGKGFTKGEGRIWLRPTDTNWNRVLAEYGLFLMRVQVPQYPEYDLRFLPHGMRQAGIYSAPVWSSELPWLQEIGVKFLGIHWALTGDEVDEGIRRYAEWALEQAERHPNLKQMLLATYGILGSRASSQAPIRQGDTDDIYWDQHKFRGTAGEWSEYRSAPATNVVQRGIIEAYTRMLTLRYACSLPRHTQLAIYGDAVIIDGHIVCPMPEPWREKGELTNLTFRNAVQFTSDQISRLPGVRQ